MNRPRASLVIALPLLSLIGGSCSSIGPADDIVLDQNAQPIIGGVETRSGEYPAVVSLGGCSGTLVHPYLVVYAEHCGTAIRSVRFGPDASHPTRVVATDKCRGYPGARLGNGTDLAYCVLEEPVLDIEPERILAGCERLQVASGQPATIVGFGVEEQGGDYGRQRVASSQLENLDDEMLLRPGATDTCRGDSGGPVFVELVEPDGTIQRRLLAVTSAGTEAECGRGLGHYVNLSNKLTWLEDASQFDVTPCFDGDEWAPTPRCLASRAIVPDRLAHDGGMDGGGVDGEGVDGGIDAGQAGVALHLGTCGDPFDPERPLDSERPNLKWRSPSNEGSSFPLLSTEPYAEFPVDVDASDRGWGIANVTISLFDPSEELLFQRIDEVPPYGLPLLRVPAGTFTLEARASDFAGNTRRATIEIRVGNGEVEPPRSAGCTLGRAPDLPGRDPLDPVNLTLAMALSGLCARLRRKPL